MKKLIGHQKKRRNNCFHGNIWKAKLCRRDTHGGCDTTGNKRNKLKLSNNI